MGTKAKLSTKVLSVFLSVLMAASCLSVALPSLAPKVFAATAEQTAWQNLADAFVAAYNGGYMSTKDWTGITTPEGGPVEVTDGTANGYAYNIVVALGELLTLIGADKHNSELRTEISQTLADDYSVTLNGYQTNFLNKLLDVSGIYGTYHPGNIWNGTNADMAANLTAKTITVSVTREESAAILSDFDSIAELAAANYKVVTGYSFTVNAAAVACDPTETGPGVETGAYYANSSVDSTFGAAHEAADKAELAKILAYSAYVESSAFTNLFNEWYNDGVINNDYLYTLMSDDIGTLVHDYYAVYTPISTIGEFYVEEYLGTSNVATHKTFVDNANAARAVVDYKDYVEWLLNGVPYGGETRNRDDYDTTDPQSIQAVITQAETFKSRFTGVSSTTIDKLRELYPAFDPSADYSEEARYANFDNYIKYLSAMMYNYYLQEIKQAATTLLNNGASTTYSFSNNSSAFFNLLKNAVGSSYQEGSAYVKTSDTRVDQDKTYYTPSATYTYAATEDTEVNSNKHYFTNWAAVASPTAAGLSGYYEDTEVFTYAATEDTELAEGKTYYTLADGVYTAVTEPAVEDIGTYYERTGSYHTYVLTQDTTVSAAKVYYTQGSAYTVVTSPSKAYISTYAERSVDHYNYQLTADKVIMPGKAYFTKSGDVYTQVAEPDLDAIGTYYEIVYTAVAEPLTSYLFDYYEFAGAYYGLKGVGNAEYIEANYESSYSKTSDTAIDSTKTYYTYNEETGVYTKVTSPTAANLSTYYERAQCPINDTDLNALYTFFHNAEIYLNNAEGYGLDVDGYMGSLRTQITEMATALQQELTVRGNVTEAFLQAYQPVADKMVGYVRGGQSIQKLYADLKEMEAKLSTLKHDYSWFANDARATAMQQFICDNYNEIYDRVQAQYVEIKNEQSTYGVATVKGAYQIRQNMKRLQDLKGEYPTGTFVTIYTWLDESAQYGDTKINGSNSLGTRSTGNLKRGVDWGWLNSANTYINGLTSPWSEVSASGSKFTKGNITRSPMQEDMLRTVGKGADKFTAYFSTYNGTYTGEGNKASVSGTIAKLDTFLSNSQFTSLLGADELGLGITTLNEYIQYILSTKLFTDEMVNTIVGLLFPMLSELFEVTIIEALDEATHHGQGMDISSFNIDNLSGTLKLFINGGGIQDGSGDWHYSITFEDLTHNLGADIYPKYFGQYLIDNGYSDIGKDIKGTTGGSNTKFWDKYRFDDNGNQSDAHEENGKRLYKVDIKQYLEKHPNVKFDWGINSTTASATSTESALVRTAKARFDKFCQVLGTVFGAALPLLKTLFGDVDFSGPANDAAVAWANPVRYKIGVTLSADLVGYNLEASIRVNHLDLYKTLWIPLMEALGINGPLLEDYTFKDVSTFTGSSYSTPQQKTNLVTALLEPVWKLILQVSNHPLDSILKILPNLCYHLMNNSVQTLLNRQVVFNIAGSKIGLHKGPNGGLGSSIIGAIGNAFGSAIASAINITKDINLGDMLVLENLLGFSLRDLNTLLAGVLKMVKEDAVYTVTVGDKEEARTNLPGIGTGKLACTWSTTPSNTYRSQALYKTGYNSDNDREILSDKNNHRTYITANTEGVFYQVFEWLFRAARTKGGIADILALVEAFTGNSLGDSLPEIIFALVEGIESPDLAFNALIELLNEPTYDVALYNWYKVGDNQPTINWSTTSFTYLEYQNKWTEEKAEYVYENVDNIVNAVVNMITPETLEQFDGDVNVWLDKTINSMFNNEGIMNVIEVVVKVGEALAGSPAIAKLIRQQVKSANTSDPAANLYAWYNVWGYLYREENSISDFELENNQFIAYNHQNNQVFIYEAVPKSSDVETVTLANNTNAASPTAAYSWKIVRAIPVGPNDSIPWRINGTYMYSYDAKPYNDSAKYGVYKNMFSNLRWTEAGESEDGDILYTWEVKLTKDIISHMKDNGTTLKRVGTAPDYTGYNDDGTTYNLGSWYPLIDGAEFDDLTSENARAIFSAVFSELATPLSAVASFILSGTPLYLFGTDESNALTIQGYPAYNNAILPLMEVLGVYDLKTQDEFNTMANASMKNAFDYLVNMLFEALDNLLTDDRVYDDDGNVVSGKGAFQKFIDVMPHLYYFLQSDGLTTIVKNLPMFVWQLLDTLRPIANIDLDDIIHALLCNLLGLKYKAVRVDSEHDYSHNSLTTALLETLNMSGKEPTDTEVTRDAPKVDGVFGFSIENMTLESIYSLVKGLTGLNLYPLTYALEGMCQTKAPVALHHQSSGSQTKPYEYTSYQVPQNYSTYTTYTLNFEGRDTITVTLEALLDILRYEQNAAALDELFGTVGGLVPGAGNLLTGEGMQGLIEAIVTILEDSPYGDRIDRPNWDYIFEGRMVVYANGDNRSWENIINTNEEQVSSASRWSDLVEITNVANYDFSRYHAQTLYNLEYLTSWSEQAAEGTYQMLSGVLDYIVSLIDLSDQFEEGTDVSTFSAVVDALLAQKVFTPDLMIKLLDLLANVYTYLPDDILDVISTLLTDDAEHGAVVDMTAWRESGYIIKDMPWHEVNGEEVQYSEGAVDDEGHAIEPVWQANRNFAWFNRSVTAYYDDAHTKPIRYIESEETFIEAFGKLLEPAGTLFALIFLGEDYNLLYKMNPEGTNTLPGDDAIVINSVNAYATAIVPLLEALGLVLYAPENGIDYRPTKYYNSATDTYNGSLFVSDLVDIIDVLFKDIIYGPRADERDYNSTREGGPVMWIIQNLPNIIYFINADGIKASINNVFGAVNQVFDAIGTVVNLPVDFHNLLDSGLDLTNITMEGLFGMIYTLTKSYEDNGDVIPGLYMSESLLNYIKNIYLGKIEAFTSANGFQSFRMVYSDKEEAHDMITIILAMLLEFATDSGTFVDNVDSHGNEIEYNNAEALDRLLFKGSEYEGVIGDVIAALRNPQALVVTEMNWDYFATSVNIVDNTNSDYEISVEIPGYDFQYLNWTTEWTYTKAQTASDEFEDLIFQALKMLVPEDPDDIEEGSLIEKVAEAEDMGDILSIDFIFSGDLLQKVYDFVSDLLYGEDSLLNEDLVNLIGYILGGDFTEYNGKLGFATVAERPAGALVENIYDNGNPETGSIIARLYYLENIEVEVPAVMDGDTVVTPATTKTLDKQYQIVAGSREDFIAGLTKVLTPAKGLLGWLLFGEDYTFFNPHDTRNEYLLTIPGSNGYKDGLILTLEALGCDSQMKYASSYIGHTNLFITDLVNSIADKAEDICNDPVNQIVELLPELIYFINAGGLARLVTGLLSGPLGLVNQVSALAPVLQTVLHLPETVAGATDTSSQYALVEQTFDSLIKSLIIKAGGEVDAENTDLNFTLTGVNLKYIFSLIEAFTGMEITDVIGSRLDLFKIGEIHAYGSKSGDFGHPALAYKMTFAATSSQGTNDSFADFVTIVLSAVVDLIEYKVTEGGVTTYVNAEALAELLKLGDKAGILIAVAKLLKSELNAQILPIDWLYFDADMSRYEDDGEGGLKLKETQPVIDEATVTIPTATINYLTYASDWTQSTSQYIVDHFSEILDGILGMFVKDEETGDPSTLSDIINDNFSLANNVFNYENYTKVLDLVADIAGKVPDVLNTLLNIALEMDLSALSTIEKLTEEEYEALTDTGKKNEFVSKLIAILTPLRPIVEWFFFNQSLEYFDKKTDTGVEALISLGGASAYNDALIPLLEAIDVNCPSYEVPDGATVAERNVIFGNFLSILIEKVLIRVEQILQDPAAAVVDLLPNLIYFINANGLATVLNNLVAPLVALVNDALPAIVSLSPELAAALEANGLTTESTLTLNEVIKVVLALFNSGDEEEGEEPEDPEAPIADDEPTVLDYILDNMNVTKLDLVAIMRLVEGLLSSGLIKIKDEDAGTEKVIQANIKLVDVVGEEKIDNFYLNDIEYFRSANGKAAFRMPGSADMITVLINYLLEVLLYQNGDFSNAAEIDKIINDEEDPANLVTTIVNLIYGIREIQEVDPAELDWNYWDDSQTLGDGINIPSHKFVYLDYSNQWSFEKAVYIDTGLEDIVEQILTIAGVPNGDITELVNGLINLGDFLNAETLNGILGFINGIFNSDDSIDLPQALTDIIGLILNVDITKWDGTYDFVAEGTATATDEASGLGYYEADGMKHYIVDVSDDDYSDFSSGLQLILEPAQGLLGWLLLGNTFAFFVPSDTGNVIYTATTDTEIVEGKTYYVAAVVGDETVYTAVETPDASAIGSYFEAVRQHNELIRVPGSNGYDAGLVLLLEALGCEVKPYTYYEGDCAALIKDVIDAVLGRLDDILDSPIEELLALIPEIIYFINVGGLGAMVQNVASVLLAIVNEVLESHLLDSMVEGDLAAYLTPNNDGTNAEDEPYNGTYRVDLDAIMTDLFKEMLGDKAPADFTFSFDTVNLQFVIDMVEIFTGLEIDDVVGYTMDKFIIGVVESYDSVSETYTETYRVVFADPIVDPEHPENQNIGQTRADMITILISLAIDLLDNDDNVDALVELINSSIEDPEEQISADTINAIMDLLKGGNLDDMIDIDWFYFDARYSLYEEDGITEKDPRPTVTYDSAIATPERTINYIEYYTDWTRDTADYLVNNIDAIVAEVLTLAGVDATSVADLIAGVFTVDQLYTKDLFVTILDAIQGLIDNYGETLVNAIGLIIGGDFSVYADIDTEALVVNDKESFINTLVQVLEPIYTLLNWFLFGEDMKYFYDNDYYNSLAANGGDASSVEGPEARNLINLTGAEGYKYGLVPLLEALGVDVPAFPTSGKLVAGEDFMKNLLTAVFTRLENILADPVTEVVAMLPELLYFINAGGLTASVYNLLNAVVGLLPQISDVIAALGIDIEIAGRHYDEIDIDDIVNDLLANYLPDDANVTVNVKHITLITIAEIIEAFTGLEITDVVTASNIRYFYFGKLVAYPSGSGKTGFKMVYKNYPEDVDNIAKREAEPEMLTLLINFIVEVLLYKDEANGIDNVAALEALLELDDDTKDIVDTIISLLTGDEDIYTYQYKELKWNYFDETVTIKTVDPDTGVVTVNTALTVPTSQFIYLEYENDWTLARADGIDKNLADLVDGILQIVNGDAEYTLSDLLNGYYEQFAMDTVFTADNLNAILEFLQNFLYGDDAILGQHLVEFAGLLLGGDITGWNYTYSFADYDESTAYINEASTGLRYNAESGIKVYAIETEEDFINGLYLMLKPASNLLGWLLLGNSYNFFAVDQDASQTLTLINIPGTDAYGNAIALLLEALGVEDLKTSAEYEGDASALLKDILTGVVGRIHDIIADPVNEVLDLIPELIYFINAGGLSVIVNNIADPLLNIVNAVITKFDLSSLNSDILDAMIIDGKLDPVKYLETYVTDLLNRYTYDPVTFTLDGVNTGWAVDLIEKMTDIRIMDVIGTSYPISKFVLGTPVKYDTVSNFDAAYKIKFTEADKYNYRCDLITIVLSLAIELLENGHNQTVIEDEFGLTAGTIADVLALVKERSIQITPAYDWFYFDDGMTFDGANITTTTPERTINYLTYASNWDEDFADYLDDHLNAIIASVLELAGQGDTTVAEIIAGVFKMSDIYTVENLETIRDAIKGLVEQLETLVTDAVGEGANNAFLADAIDLIFDIDIHAWDDMTFDADVVSTKEGFASALAEIVAPISDILNWLFFGSSIRLFNRRHTDTGVVEDILVINGYDGYNEGLVPLLEALGVDLTDAINTSSIEEKVEKIILATLTRAEAILADPVDQVLALLPEIFYFINANGLAASVNHLLGAPLSLVDGINALIADLGLELDIYGYDTIDLDGILNSVLNNLLADKLDGKTLVIDTQKLDLVELVKIVELFTGLELVDVVTETKLDNFYLGQIYSYPSANGKTLFKMRYTENWQEDRADMITVLVNFIAEAALYEDNDAVIENLAGLEEGTIDMIIEALHTLSGEDYAYDWNYFWGVEGEPHAADAGYEAAFDRYATPDTQFGNYLTYKSDWTKSLANDLYNNLDTIINAVLAMTGNEASTLGEIINNNFTLYKGEYLNKILDLVKQLYDVLDDTLIGVIDEFLDVDLTYWQSLSFDEEQTYTSTEFAAAVVEIVKPIYSVIDWLFFGKDITLFVDNAAGGDPEFGGYNLIVIDSVDAYATGLAPVLEALGVELPDYDGTQRCATEVTYNGVPMDYFAAIVNAILGRVDAVLADPINEVFELLPEALYFINANGLSTAVYNMLGGVIDVVNTLIEKGIISLDAENIQAYVLDQFNVDIDKLDLVGIFNIVENIEALHGLKLNDVFTGDYNGDGIEENILEYFYIGDYANAYVSNVGNFKGYKLSLEEENKGDLLTMLLSVVLEVLLYDENEAPITELIQSFKEDFTQDDFHMIKLLLTTGIQTNPEMLNINWVYFLNLTGDELNAKIEEVLSAELNNLPEEPLERTKNALKYGGNEGVENLWNTGLREYLNQNLESIVDLAIAMATKNSDTPSNSLSDLLQNNLDLWTDDTANAILNYVKNALSRVDDVLVDTVGSLLGAGQLSTLKNTTAVGIESKEDFVDFFVETLSPLSTVLDFVLFGGEYKFFTHLSDGEPYTIILKGGEGYKYGVAPILAALGVDTDISEESTDVALREVLTKLTDRIDDILYGGDTINEALKLILNVVYFINADGLSISVSNLLAPIDELLNEVNDVIHFRDEEDLKVNDFITQVDLTALNFDFIFDLVFDKTGINVADPIGSYIKEFYFGTTEYFTSYGDLGNFRMVYTEEENRIDMITILVTLLLDVVIYDGNHEALVGLVKNLMDTDDETAEQYVATIVALLLNKDYRVPMLPYRWAFTEYGDTGTVISAANGLTGDSIFGTGLYGPLYTREMGAYISRFLPLFIDTYLVLLGVKNETGDIYRSLEDLLKQLIGDSIYTNDILQKIGSAITGAVANIKESIGEEMFNHVVNVLNASLGVDLNDILYGRIATIEEGNEEQFIQAICDLLAPAAPVLKWLLSDYDIALFNHDTVVNPTDTYNAGDDYIVLKGAEGYQNAVVPLLEALRAGDSTGIKTQAEYNELDGADMIKYILTPIFSRLDDILDDPINGILNELPAVVYFLNSNGLDTAFKNLLNAVYSLLNAIEPITGEIDLYDMIGIRLDEVNVNTLLQKVIESLNVDQQFKLSDIIADAVVELSIGTVDSFTSVRLQPEYLKGTYENGQANYNASGNAIDYTMHYSTDGAGGDQVDYVTILMRLLLKFISIPQNVTAVEAMLKGKLNDTGYKFLCSLLENFSQMAATDDGMDKIMYTVYYIFYAALNAGVATNNGLAEFNGNYSFLNQLFATSNVGFLRQLEISLGDLLNKYTPEIIDDDEVIPQGQISFWQKIINFFKKIGDFFKRLFGG